MLFRSEIESKLAHAHVIDPKLLHADGRCVFGATVDIESEDGASVTYQIVMLFVVPVQFATGIMMWDVKRFETAIAFLGGIKVVDTVHVLIYIFFVSFTMVHAYMGALGHTPAAHFKEMFTGYEEEHGEEESTS